MTRPTKGTGRMALAFIAAPAILALLSWSWVSAQALPVSGVVHTGPGRVEESDPSVVYTGVWLTQRRADLSGGSIVESPYPISTASLTFIGTGIRWIGFKAPWAGIAQVFLDGAQTATIDTYSASEQAQAVMYTATGLSGGTHTITIKVTGTWNPAGTGSWVVLDAFDVM